MSSEGHRCFSFEPRTAPLRSVAEGIQELLPSIHMVQLHTGGASRGPQPPAHACLSGWLAYYSALGLTWLLASDEATTPSTRCWRRDQRRMREEQKIPAKVPDLETCRHPGKRKEQ